jgi:hypothetical protein
MWDNPSSLGSGRLSFRKKLSTHKSALRGSLDLVPLVTQSIFFTSNIAKEGKMDNNNSIILAWSNVKFNNR